MTTIRKKVRWYPRANFTWRQWVVGFRWYGHYGQWSVLYFGPLQVQLERRTTWREYDEAGVEIDR